MTGPLIAAGGAVVALSLAYLAGYRAGVNSERVARAQERAEDAEGALNVVREAGEKVEEGQALVDAASLADLERLLPG